VSHDHPNATQGLARIDLTTLQLTPIAAYDTLSKPAELTGTADGRLFGVFQYTQMIVAEIDKTTAHIGAQVTQPAFAQPCHFAVAFWGGDFWFFGGPTESSYIFRYRPSNGTTVLLDEAAYEIVGAGVSTCAPLEPPG